MKYDIQVLITDLSQPNGKSFICLNANQPLALAEVTFPLIWDGYINGSKIRINQKGWSSTNVGDFIFYGMPENTYYTQSLVIEAIQGHFNRFI